MQLFSRNKAIVALSLGALALGACGDDVTVPITPDAPITLSITPPSANMNVGEAVNFAVQISGGPATNGPTLLSCTTSSATVATATVSGSSCRVTAIGAGNATITAAASTGQSAAASVSVAAPAAAISGLMVSPSAASIQVNQTVTIVPTYGKASAAVVGAPQFTSSNSAVATVNATTGVVTAVAPGVATISVSVTGSGAGFTTTTLTSAAAITVTALPTGITSLNVTPSTLALASGATAQLAASAQQPTGAAAAVITYGTTAPAVATVSTTGLVTAVGPGTAVITVTATSPANTNFAAATLSGTVAVTVSPAAQISISSITDRAGTAVDVNSVNGQIQINTNLVTNGQLVTAVSAYICQVGETVAACVTRSGTPAAQQTFGTGGAANGVVTLSVNTADFVVASDWSSATTKYTNGQNVVVTTITTAGGDNTANSNLAILNFTNTDGFAARHIAPTTTATSSTGVAYFGGPGAAGRGSISIVPVTYTAGRTVKAATAGLPAVAGCTGSVSFTSAATPWTYTYGRTFGTATGANATNIICTGAVATLDVTPVVTASTYSNDTQGPTATGSVESAATTNNFLTVSSSTTPVVAPASIRVDYLAPTGGAFVFAAGTWANATTNFNSSTYRTLASEAPVGVGLPTTPNIRYYGCPITSDTTSLALPTLTGADIPECATSNSNNVYTLVYYPIDRLGNVGTTAVSATFGVDKTAPIIRYSTASADDLKINPTTAVAFQVEALDERSGLTSIPSHYLARTLRASTSTTGWAVGANSSCIVQGTPLTAGFGSLFITAPGCSYAPFTYNGITTIDGYSQTTPVNTITLTTIGDGYYVYRARVSDEAGNTTEVVRRAVMINDSPMAAVAARSALNVGTIRADTLIAAITSEFTGPFTGQYIDSVETKGTGLRLQYGALSLAYPMTATSAVAFDNVITRDSIVSATTPFTSGVRVYTSLEQTTVGNTTGGTDNPLSASGVYAQNFGGNGTSAFAGFLTGSITFDVTAWSAKTLPPTRFSVVSSDSSYNSPTGGLKAQAVGPANVFNSPFTRVDFYRQIPTTTEWEYVGSVDGSVTPCISVSQTCGVYIGENTSVTERVITYVLRTGGTSATSTNAIALNDGVYVAVGTRGTAGRGLLTQPSSTFAPPPPPAASRR